MNTVRTILFIGRPSSGKETQAHLLAEKTGYAVFSTGEKFRELREHRDALGARVREVYDQGKLLPAWFADYLFQDVLLKLSPEAGIILEGSGRTIAQAELIHGVLEWLGRAYTVINLEVSEAEVIRRSLARKRDATDASEEIIRTRLAEYKKLTEPAISYFRSIGTLIDIEGEQAPEKVHADVCMALGL